MSNFSSPNVIGDFDDVGLHQVRIVFMDGDVDAVVPRRSMESGA